MPTGLIVALVVSFFLIDGVILYFVFASRRSADDYGAIAVPGETTITLAAGKAKLNYQESYKAAGTDDSIDFVVPAGLLVTVASATGEALDIRGPGFKGVGSSLSTGSGWSRALIGTVDVREPGLYTVAARGELPDAIEPQVLIGK